MAIKIQLRNDTAANWTSVNPILALGERGVETDTGKEKSGDGVTAWNSLAYFGGGGSYSLPTASTTVLGGVKIDGTSITISGTGVISSSGGSSVTPSSTTPLVDSGSGAVGVATTYARGDHVHPTDSTKANLASPTFTGTPTAPTPSAGTNTTQIATTAFVAANFAALQGTATVFGGAKFSLSGTTLTITTV